MGSVGGWRDFLLLSAVKAEKIYTSLSLATLSLLASANKQLRHLRILSVYCYEDDIYRSLERVYIP